MLTVENSDLVKALAKERGKNLNKIVKKLIFISEHHGVTFRIIDAAIKSEVEDSSSVGTLFRANSFASKFLKAYTDLIGIE